jgi:signal transduction histidine kinase
LPRSLFLKIFLWFVAVMFTVIVGTFLVGELTRPERSGPPMRRQLDPALSAHAQSAAEVFENEGQTALLAYLDRLQRENNVRAFLFNEQLQELSGRRVREDAPHLARRTFESQRPELSQSGRASLHARPVSSSSGARYVLVLETAPPPGPGGYHPILHMLAVGLVGAAFCYWLARYLTSPVAKLRAATKELARGNLSVRVTPALGKRRDELTYLGEDFDQMAEQIEALINSQRRLLGDISHELRSPLARLNVALELARQRSGPAATSALERIQREAENLNEMIGQLLALTRLEGGDKAVEKTEFDLAELVRQIADDAEFEARSRNRSVALKSLESCPVTGNYELLRRAIENVVRNAIHYTADGTTVEVELRVDASESPEGRALITVRDHGPGVPENALEDIFRPFYRVDDARDREAGGVGLGLAIAERAVKLHGGTVTAMNAQDGGLVVTITLPVNKQQTANSKESRAAD